jgi:predicted nucleic acid-binding protein
MAQSSPPDVDAMTAADMPIEVRRLGRFTLRNLDEEILVQAGAHAAPTLRSLDAIHLATAASIAAAAADEFEALITYDSRLADIAKADGLRVVAPA